MRQQILPAHPLRLKILRTPFWELSRFMFRRSIRSSVLWAVVFGGYFASKAIGIVAVYLTAAARLKLAHSYGSNVGIELLLGSQKHVTSAVGSVAAWNTLGVLTVIAAVWGISIGSRLFRGEEAAGRMELLLTGITTKKRASISIFTGLCGSLFVFYTILAVLVIGVGQRSSLGLKPYACLYFCLCPLLSAMVFIALSALCSQLRTTRTQVATLAGAVFGAAFLVRGSADITTANWLLDITPLGWIEHLQPFGDTHAIWLVPLMLFILGCCLGTIHIAGSRDLGDALVPDKTTARPRLRLLGSALGLSVRINHKRMSLWVIGLLAASLLFGSLSKSAAQDFDQSETAKRVLAHLVQHTTVTATNSFLGITFFLLMLIVMLAVASLVAHIRQTEADSMLDCLLVRQISRRKYLSVETVLILSFIAMSVCCILVGTWIGATLVGASVSGHTLLTAAINVAFPALAILGFGIVCNGVLPRLTIMGAYGLLGWSFLLAMLSSGLTLNHWLLDTSLLHQVEFAPAASPNWVVNGWIAGLATVSMLVGIGMFNRRDIVPE